MLGFVHYNPTAIAVYYFCCAGIAMFSLNPIILCLSLIGSLLCFFLCVPGSSFRSHEYMILLFFVMTLINPLVSHNGVTVLFVMNHNPVTLEALIYGAVSAAMILSVLYWFRSFSHIMTSDKLLYLFGRFSPKLSLVISMALRYVPLFGQQIKKISQSQKAMGLYKEDNIIDRLRGGLRIFSVMITWALENGIVTADSMTARGYGLGRRSSFSIFSWTGSDIILLLLSIGLGGITLWGILNHTILFYPEFVITSLSFPAGAGYVSYALLMLLPLIIHIKEAIQWRCLKSAM